MAKKSSAEEMAALGGMGKEIPGDDLTADFDPMTSEHAETPLDELERIIDREAAAAERSAPSADSDEYFEQQHSQPEDDRKQHIESLSPDSEGKVEPEQEQAEDTETQKAESDTEQTDATDNGESGAREVSVQEQIASLQRELEISRIRDEKREAELERATLLRDREAGEKGSLLQKLEALERRLTQPSRDEDSLELDERRVAGPETRGSTASALPPELQAELSEIRSERLARALEHEQQDFAQEALPWFEKVKTDYGDETALGLIKGMNDTITREYEAVKEVLYGKNVQVSAKLARSIMRTAYADARMNFLRNLESSASAKVAEAKAKKEQERKAAGITGSEGASGGPPKKPTLNPVTADLKDLEKAIDAEYGINRDVGREII